MMNPVARPGLGGDEPDERPLHLQELRPYHPRQCRHPAHKQTLDEQYTVHLQSTVAKITFLLGGA